MKRIVKLVTLFTILLIVLSIASVKTYATKISEVLVGITATKAVTTIDSTLLIKLGDTNILNVNGLSSDETIATWTSSDENVLKIDQNGMVITKGAGKVTVTAKTTKSREFKAKVLVWNIKLTNGQYWTYGGPKTSTHKEILYSTAYVAGELTSNKDRFKILAIESNNSKNKSVKAGQYIVNSKSSDYTFSLKPAKEESNPGTVTEVKIDPAEASIVAGKGNTTQLKAIVIPSDVSQAVVWKIMSDTTKATVSTNGKVTLSDSSLKEGDKIIVRATSQVDSNIYKECTIVVTAKPVDVTKVVISAPEDAVYKPGNEITLTAKVTPEGATNKELTWTSNNDNVTVSPTGIVTISSNVKAGTVVTIKATSVSNSKISGNYTFTIVESTSAIKLNKTEIIVEKGKTKTLTPTVDAFSGGVEWESSNKSIATVTKKGVVKGVAKGECIITATSTLDKTKTATCKVTVGKPVTSITFSKSTYKIALNDTSISVNPTIKPKDAANTELKYTTNPEGIIEIKDNKIIPLAGGKTKLTATNPITGKSGSCTVEIIAPAVAVQGIAFENPPKELPISGSAKLNVVFTPTNATNTNIKSYKSSDKNIATVSTKGKVTISSKAKAGQTVTITATSTDGEKTATCTITVTPKNVTKIALNKTSVNLAIGKTVQLKATISPAGASQEVTWASSNSNIATVDENGLVTVKAAGEATITATSKADSSKKKECKITTYQGISSIKFTEDNDKVMYKGDKQQLEVKVLPEKYEGSLKWTSSNSNIIKVIDSKTGEIKAMGKGTATITVSGKGDNGKTISKKITIKVKVESSGGGSVSF